MINKRTHLPYKVQYKIDVPESNPSALVVFYYKDKYVFAKFKNVYQGISAVQKSLRQFLNQLPENRNQGNLYFHFFNFIEQNPDGEIECELLFSEVSPYELLVEEQKALDNSTVDPNCLNNAFEAYVPQYDEVSGMYGWINKGERASFMRYLKSKERKDRLKQIKSSMKKTA